MATSELTGFKRILESTMQAHVDDMLGRRSEPGLSFKVRGDDRNWLGFWSGQRRVYNRPFTKSEHRRYVWSQRKARVKRRGLRPFRTVKSRSKAVWDALRGRECECWD